VIWIILIALALIVTAILVAPLVRRDGAAITAEAGELAVYRSQLKELDEEAARGALPASEVAAARLEIERRMLKTGEAKTQRSPRRERNLPLALAIALLVPLASLVMYSQLGRPLLPAQPLADRADAAQAAQQHQSFQLMASRLAERLAKEPNDLNGWKLLARTYAALDRQEEAASALRRAMAIAPDDAGLPALLGETLVFANDGLVGTEAQAAFEKSAALDADQPAPRFYLALAHAQKGEWQKAFDGWMTLWEMSTEDAPWRESLRAQLAEAAGKLGIDVTSRLPDAPKRDPDGLSGDQMDMVRGMVERLASRLETEPGDGEGWLRLARARVVLGERAAAIAAYEKALALIDPRSAEAEDARRALEAQRR